MPEKPAGLTSIGNRLSGAVPLSVSARTIARLRSISVLRLLTTIYHLPSADARINYISLLRLLGAAYMHVQQTNFVNKSKQSPKVSENNPKKKKHQKAEPQVKSGSAALSPALPPRHKPVYSSGMLVSSMGDSLALILRLMPLSLVYL